MRLLVVEDDRTIAEPLRTGLRREGFEVELVATAAAALAADPGDLVLLDLGLPDLDGRVVCRELRARSAVPIIVVSARSEEIDRVQLLELGADDYVIKPFGFRELVARIRAVMRRAAGAAGAAGEPGVADSAGGPGRVAPPSGPIEIGPLRIDERTRQVTFDSRPVSLTRKEYELLAHLASDPHAVHTREQIMEEVWDENWWGSTKTLDVHIASLRKKLSPEAIDTVRGVGYRLVDCSAVP